ncbi:MAG TPA: SGNH/GDSL hydrolase family protein [Planktothrix sp.]
MANNQQVSKSPAVSAALVALLLYVVVNAGLAVSRTRFGEPFASPYHGWSYWSVQAMHNADPARVNVVMLGSSLVVSAVSECEALFKNQALDLCFYRRSEYFDRQMQRFLNKPYETLNLATPGQIPSDAYLVLKTALANGINPGLVIYGIAPRDFIDHTLNNAGDTEPFHYLSRLVPVDECTDEIYSTPLSQFDLKLRQTVKLYGDSPDIISALQPFMRDFVHSADGDLFHRLNDQTFMQVPLAHFDKDSQNPNVFPGTAIAEVPSSTSRPFLDNTEDYKCRYKQPNDGNYQAQVRFLDKLIALCQANDVNIVIVNMPITKGNVQLLEPAWRERYFADVQRIVKLHNVPFLDQCQFEAYAPDDFCDTVHLNGFGGRKFLDLLVARLIKEPATNRLVVAAGDHGKRSVSTSRSGID